MKIKTEVLRNTTGIRQPKTHLEYKTGFFRGAILFLRLRTNIRYLLAVFLLLKQTLSQFSHTSNGKGKLPEYGGCRCQIETSFMLQ